jgi:hypothetical protein
LGGGTSVFTLKLQFFDTQHTVTTAYRNTAFVMIKHISRLSNRARSNDTGLPNSNQFSV